MVNRKDICDRAEAAVGEALQAEGFAVMNLNQLAQNCPFMDLLARRESDRMLVQVKGTTTADGKFGTHPATARALVAFATALNCHAIYGFVHLRSAAPTIRFATAAEVATLAEADLIAYQGTNRFHVNIDQFTVHAHQVDTLFAAT